MNARLDPASAPFASDPATADGFAPAATWLLFEAGGQTCALDSRLLRQIAPASAIQPLPGPAHPAWPGVFVWQRRVLAVLDCGVALGRPRDAGEAQARVLVVQHGGEVRALRVERVRGLHAQDPAQLIDVCAGLPPPWRALRWLLPLHRPAGAAAVAEVAAVLDVPALFAHGVRPLKDPV